MRRIVAWDTETFPIGPKACYPRMVCSTFAERVDGEIKKFLIGNGDAELQPVLRGYLESDAIMVGHNIAYDLMVCCNMFPELEPLIWAKLERGEVTDTQLREQLLFISRTGRLDFVNLPDGSALRLRFDLAALVERYLMLNIDETKGEDTWRMQFSLLDNLKAAQYPREAADYAINDASYTLQVYEHQEKAERRGNLNDPFHTACAFALAVMTETGCRIDADEYLHMKADLEGQLSDDKMNLLIKSGIMRPSSPALPYVKQVAKAEEILGGGPIDWRLQSEESRQFLMNQGIKFKAPVDSSIDTEVLKNVVAQVSKERGIPVEYTPTGAVSTKAEYIKALADFDEILGQYFFRQSLQKLVTTELPRMEWEGKPAPVVHAPFKTLISTLRTSSAASDKYPSWNGQNVDPRAKGCVIPRTGNVICSTDYATLELATVAHTTYVMFGASVHREKILAGCDLHAYLGAQLMKLLDPTFRKAVEGMSPDETYKLFVSFKKGTPEEQAFYKKGRKFAKPVGLGYPGGLGPERFIALAKKKPYWVDVEATAAEMPEDFFKIDESMIFYFGKLYWGNQPEEIKEAQTRDEWSRENFHWNSYMKAIYLAKTMRDLWMETYPEMKLYFEHVKKEMTDERNPNIGSEERPMQGYAYEAPTGEFIAGCAYTEVCNGFAMQTPAAIGAKLAVFRVVRACRDSSQFSILLGSLPLLFIHDEILVEFPEDDLMTERAKEVQKLMSAAMAEIIPTVKVGTETCLMYRWSKDAQPAFDENGRLRVWQPAPVTV